MTVFLASRALAALLLAVAVPVAAMAQDEPGPRRLLLPETEATAPVPDAPGAEAPPAADFEGVSVGLLEAVGGGAVGTLGGDDGLGAELWQGADAARVRGLMARLPAAARSPAMRALMRRLLLSAAAPPPNAGAFLASRVAALLRLGAYDDAAQLAALAPMASASPELAAVEADALFWAGSLDRACAVAATEIRGAASAGWLGAMAFCQLRAGQADAAQLSLALAREQAGAGAGPLLALAANLIEGRGEPAAVLDDGLGLAMTLAAEAAIDEEALATASPAALRALALNADVAVATRLAAGEQAAALGAITAAELTQLYLRPVFANDELLDARLVAGQGPAALGRALLFQAVRRERDPDRRALLLDALWSHDPGGPGFLALARAAGVGLLTLTPGPTTMWFAPDAVRALLAAGRGEAAEAWYLRLSEAAIDDPEARTAQVEALPPLAAAGVGSGRNWNTAMAVHWWRGLPDTLDAPARAAVATRVFMVLDALGRPMGGEVWDLFLDAPSHGLAEVPNLGIRYALRDAARGGRRGETVLLAMLTLGEAGPAEADALALGGTIRALRAVGLGEDARALALEALIGGAR